MKALNILQETEYHHAGTCVWATQYKLVNNCRCIANKTNMVTASYCTDPMRAPHDKAVEAGMERNNTFYNVKNNNKISNFYPKGITVVNEVGVDPGIDHLLAMECFDEVHTAGGKVESFISYCGGQF